jgi:cation transport regulator ChaC
MTENADAEQWYFAYGSNLSIDQMIARTGPISQGNQGPRIARLANYRLVFQNVTSDEPAFANIISPGDGVLGVVYRCNPAALEKLDRFEQGYERRPITVADEQGKLLAAVAYVFKTARGPNFGKPSAEYLNRIVTGARQHGLPEAYIAKIAANAGIMG